MRNYLGTLKNYAKEKYGDEVIDKKVEQETKDSKVLREQEKKIQELLEVLAFSN